MIIYEVTFQDGKSLHLGPFPGRNETIEKMLDTTRKSGMAAAWRMTTQEEAERSEGGTEKMGTVESIRRCSDYLERRRYEKERDRKFRKALAVVLVAGGILAAVVWRILF